jgi:transcriptional regulator with XRE-family HTH domain
MDALRDPDNTPTMSVRELGRILGMQHSKISRIFSGQIRPKPEDVQAIGEALGISEPELSELVAQVHLNDGASWVAMTAPDRDLQMRGLIGLEQHASHLYTIASGGLVPGILQTPDYTEAVMRAAHVPDWEIEERVQERAQRSDILIRRPNPAKLSAYIGHEALLKVIGGPEVMLDQLVELYDWTSPERANVNIQIVPLVTGWTPMMEGPFYLIEFDDGQLPVVHIEIRDTALFLHQPPDVNRYRTAVDTVRDVAMSPEESRELIAHIATEMDHRGSEFVA